MASVKPAKALTAVDASYLTTYDTTPLLTGTVDEAGSSVTVTIGGHAYAAVLVDASWTLQIPSALDYGIYNLELSATKGVATVTDTITDGLVIDRDFPFNIYVDVSLLENLLAVTFITGQTFSLNGITLTIPDNTTITKTDGGGYDLSAMIGDLVTTSNELIAKEIEFGVPDVDLTFSNALTLSVEVGSSYNGQELNLFTKSGENDGWDPMNIECTVSSGTCTFTVLHASYFAMSLYNSIAEGENDEDDEDEDDEDEDSDEEPDINKIGAKKYFSPLGRKWKIELIIKGDEYDEDTEVTLGNREAYEIKYKNDQKIIARFSLDKLINSGRDDLIVRVINGDETKKFKRKLKLSELTLDYQRL